MKTAAFVLIVLGALAGLLFGVRALQAQEKVGAETARKLVHVGMGTIGLVLPWFFSNPAPIWLLAALAFSALAVIRFVPAAGRRLGGVLGSTDRSSYGELLYPLGVALAFTLGHEDRAAYCGAMGVLVFADTAGALVGARCGTGRRKSMPGSTAVLVTSVAWLTLMLLFLRAESFGTALAIAFFVGAAATVAEAVSSRGTDNIFLPVLVVVLMRALKNQDVQQSLLVGLWVVIPILVAGLVHVTVIKLGMFRRLAAMPLDFGATFGGRTWFGQNKTLRGVVVMIGVTILCSAIHVAISSQWQWSRALLPPFQQTHPVIWGALAGVGYIVGELPNSFVKRRLGIAPGATGRGWSGAVLWFFDQIDSMLGVVIFLLLVWKPSPGVLLALFAWTLLIHPAVALVMFLLGLKTRVG